MIKVKILDKGKIKYEGQVPESWDEVTVRNYIGIQTITNDAELLSCLSGIPADIIDNTNANLAPAFEVINKYLSVKPKEFEKIRGHKITIDEKEIPFPRSIDFTTFGQNSLVKTLLNDNQNDLEKIVPDVFAIYLQPIADGKFDRERVPYWRERVLDLPIVEVRPHVLFFLRRLRTMRVVLSVDLMLSNPAINKSKRRTRRN